MSKGCMSLTTQAGKSILKRSSWRSLRFSPLRPLREIKISEARPSKTTMQRYNSENSLILKILIQTNNRLAHNRRTYDQQEPQNIILHSLHEPAAPAERNAAAKHQRQ